MIIAKHSKTIFDSDGGLLKLIFDFLEQISYEIV